MARHAGVSMKTVSNVVNGYQYVRPATRDRVRRSIEALSYRPNLAARRLASGRAGAIALVLPEINVPFFAELARIVYEQALASNTRVIIEQTIGSVEGETAVLRDRDQGFIDGMIVYPHSLSFEEFGDRPSRYPLVLLGDGESPPLIDHVFVDNEAALADAVGHLARLGRRRIAFLGAEEGPSDTITTRRRVAAYRTALSSLGLNSDPDAIFAVDWFTFADGERAILRALEAGVEFDGLVCRDDVLATGAIRALRSRGLRIPEDVAVIGWDDIPESAYLFPSLSTVRPDKHGIAETALALLRERIDGYTGPGRHHAASHELILRESAPPDVRRP